MTIEPFGLYFIMGGKDYAFRTWPGVPRVGEQVMMHPQGSPTVHTVLEVVWGVKGDDDPRGRVSCNVLISQPLPARS